MSPLGSGRIQSPSTPSASSGRWDNWERAAGEKMSTPGRGHLRVGKNGGVRLVAIALGKSQASNRASLVALREVMEERFKGLGHVLYHVHFQSKELGARPISVRRFRLVKSQAEGLGTVYRDLSSSYGEKETKEILGDYLGKKGFSLKDRRCLSDKEIDEIKILLEAKKATELKVQVIPAKLKVTKKELSALSNSKLRRLEGHLQAEKEKTSQTPDAKSPLDAHQTQPKARDTALAGSDPLEAQADRQPAQAKKTEHFSGARRVDSLDSLTAYAATFPDAQVTRKAIKQEKKVRQYLDKQIAYQAEVADRDQELKKAENHLEAEDRELARGQAALHEAEERLQKGQARLLEIGKALSLNQKSQVSTQRALNASTGVFRDKDLMRMKADLGMVREQLEAINLQIKNSELESKADFASPSAGKDSETPLGHSRVLAYKNLEKKLVAEVEKAEKEAQFQSSLQLRAMNLKQEKLDLEAEQKSLKEDVIEPYRQIVSTRKAAVGILEDAVEQRQGTVRLAIEAMRVALDKGKRHIATVKQLGMGAEDVDTRLVWTGLLNSTYKADFLEKLSSDRIRSLLDRVTLEYDHASEEDRVSSLRGRSMVLAEIERRIGEMSSRSENLVKMSEKLGKTHKSMSEKPSVGGDRYPIVFGEQVAMVSEKDADEYGRLVDEFQAYRQPFQADLRLLKDYKGAYPKSYDPVVLLGKALRAKSSPNKIDEASQTPLLQGRLAKASKDNMPLDNRTFIFLAGHLSNKASDSTAAGMEELHSFLLERRSLVRAGRLSEEAFPKEWEGILDSWEDIKLVGRYFNESAAHIDTAQWARTMQEGFAKDIEDLETSLNELGRHADLRGVFGEAVESKQGDSLTILERVGQFLSKRSASLSAKDEEVIKQQVGLLNKMRTRYNDLKRLETLVADTRFQEHFSRANRIAKYRQGVIGLSPSEAPTSSPLSTTAPKASSASS